MHGLIDTETNMPLSQPLTELEITTDQSGFYKGFNTFVTVGSKCLIGLLILWAAVWSEQAGAVLKAINGFLLDYFGHWYMYVVFFYIVACLFLAFWPQRAKSSLANRAKSRNFQISHGSP